VDKVRVRQDEENPVGHALASGWTIVSFVDARRELVVGRLQKDDALLLVEQR